MNIKKTYCWLSATVLVGLLLGCPPSTGGTGPMPSSGGTCGNNKKQSGEKCDGDDLNDKTCEELGYGPGQLACKLSCDDFDRSRCGASPDCNNNTREGVEVCDGTDLDDETCESIGLGAGMLACLSNCGDFDTSSCGPPPDCGDNEINGEAELCDGDDFGNLTCERLGYDGGDLRCLNDCQYIDQSGCTSSCQPDCSGRVCGPDPNCGVSCGQCDSGSCVGGQCVAAGTDAASYDVGGHDAGGRDTGASCPADKDCSGRVCGPDPVCGLSCGTCNSGTCNGNGQCIGGQTCTQGSRRCSTDNYGFEACGYNPDNSIIEYGPRIPCSVNESCSGGICSTTSSECRAVETVVLLDRSSSMLSGDIWTWVLDVIKATILYRDAENAFGFRQFPSGSGCSVGSLVPLGRHNGSNIVNSISAPTSGASTPIEQALTGLRSAYGDPNDGQAVILISDGDETCDTAAGAIEEASALLHSGTLVYTIAVTTTANRTLLDNIAQVGGTGSSRLVTDAQGLWDGLEEIFAELAACRDCIVGPPYCDGDTIHYCGGETLEMASTSCSAAGDYVCGNYDAINGDRCLGSEGAGCSEDATRYLQVCDPNQTLTCIDSVCTAPQDAGSPD